MKRFMAFSLALILSFTCVFAIAESSAAPVQPSSTSDTPPSPPDGQAPSDRPGNPPDGQAPDGLPGNPPDGQAPDGAPGNFGGMPQNQQPESYAAVTEVTEDTAFADGTYSSAGTDENVFHILSGIATIQNATITRSSEDSTGGDSASFYGVGAAVLTTGGTVKIANSTITTDAAGGAGVFAYGDGVAYVSDSTITTQQDTSGGIHVAGGGTLYARDLTVTTNGNSAAVIRSDRGGGTMVVDGGTYTSNGTGSPAVYVTADISIRDATLAATGSEALCLEGLNTVRLFDSTLSGNMQDLEQNDNTWTVILYQSMSGDSQVGEGRFEMVGGTLNSSNGGLFYTTNTESEFILSNVVINAANDSEYFLRCTGNANQRGWGASGTNGSDCKFTAIAQQMNGNVVWDSISQLQLYVTESSVLTGAVLDDESCAVNGGDGSCNVTLDGTSRWIVTGDSVLSALYNAGSIQDADGNLVTIQGSDGTIYVQGQSQYTVTVSQYSTEADTSAAGVVSNWSDYAVEF